MLRGKVNEKTIRGLMCVQSSDEHFKRVVCDDLPEKWFESYGRWGIRTIWNYTRCPPPFNSKSDMNEHNNQEGEEILPCRLYARHCILAAAGLGELVYSNFVDHTWLADRSTSLRTYIHEVPSILNDLPPPSLIDRYSG